MDPVKFIVENWYLILAALVSGGLLLWPTLRRGVDSTAISTAEAVRLINREKGVLIDVADAAEFAAGHAAGARNLPLADLASAKGVPSNKALPLVLLCPNGSRAKRAAVQLRAAGYAKAAAVDGGTAAWRAANLPIEKQS
jgi:rhodanese-related sulfurtransferase